MQSRPAVSLCMIVKNEERNLPGCLKSVQCLVDEMVIVDTGSEDRTVSIAESFGARVYHLPWGDDFSAARNESLRHARSDWIFYLDADERLDPMGEEDCLRKAASARGVQAYVVPIRNLKRSKTGTGAKISSSIRMFANSPGIRFEGAIHERVDASLERIRADVGRARFVIEHEGYDADSQTLRGKLQRNVDLLLKRLDQAPDSSFDLYYLGLSLSALDKVGESIEAFRQAREGSGLSPILHAMVLNQLASYHLSRQEYQDVIDLAQKSLALTPHQCSAQFLLGMAHYRRQEHGTALPLLLDARRFLSLRAEDRPGDLGHEMNIDEAELAKSIKACRSLAAPKMGIPDASPAAETSSSLAASRPALSVCMIVKNEAHHLAEALSHFQPFADEIVVVDTGSTDGTQEIARRFTSQIFDFPWVDDFSAARNFSFAHARGSYVLWLDADDRFQREMQERINRLKAHFDGKKAFYFLLESLNGKSGQSTFCYQLRCLPASEGLRFTGRVHEQILPSAIDLGLELVKTDIVLQHEGYMDQAVYLRKMRRNLYILEKEREDERDSGALHYFLALTRAALGNEAEAIGAMESAVERISMEGHDRQLLAEGYLFLGIHHLKTGNMAASLRAAIKTEALGGEEPHNNFRLGILYQELDRHSQALRCLGKALERKPAHGFYPSGPPLEEKEICLHMAYSLWALDKNDAALEKLNSAREMGMGVCESWERLAARALGANRFDLAFRAYVAAERTGELDADGYCNLGVLFRGRGLQNEAAACYEEALRKEPQHRDCLANLAHLCLAQNEAIRAKQIFETLVADGARDMDLLLGLALSSLKVGDWPRFGAAQQQILKDPALGSMAKSPEDATNCTRDAAFIFADMIPVLESQGRKATARIVKTIVQTLTEHGRQPLGTGTP